ncbi:hypothetical protein M422DRAFT_29232 [Sphaerobolus stellatus SS14]|nr:hypothetical protein M422DRAFT_29232 [Sphaerobolus stellatus SS14]
MLCGYNPFDYDSDGSRIQTSASAYPRREPSYCRDDSVIMSRIIGSSVDFQDELWSGMSDARDLVRHLLIQNPKHRETVNGALKSRWIQKDMQELRGGYESRVLGKSYP